MDSQKPLDRYLKEKEDTKYITQVQDIQGRRVTNASKSREMRDYVTREEIEDILVQLRAQGLTIEF